jgi:hypothetical protein
MKTPGFVGYDRFVVIAVSALKAKTGRLPDRARNFRSRLPDPGKPFTGRRFHHCESGSQP